MNVTTIYVRPYDPCDNAFVLGLAPRLCIGKQPWRDDAQWLRAVEGWLQGSVEQHGQNTFVLIAHNDQGERLGVATVSHGQHFTGQPQASIGELATTEAAEGQGVGTALVQACEQWAREQAYALLTLTTGAANTRARDFYEHCGFHDEDVTLTKPL